MPTPHLHMSAELTKPIITDITVNSGWTQNRQCQIIEFNGIIYLRGYLTKATGAETTVFTLPEEYRPKRTLLFQGYNTGKPEPAKIQVESNGVVKVWDGSFKLTGINSVSLDACYWLSKDLDPSAS